MDKTIILRGLHRGNGDLGVEAGIGCGDGGEVP